MGNLQTVRGLSTICYYAIDHEAAKRWYSDLLGIPPYFERPGYAPAAITYWHVDEVGESLEKLLSLGARLHEPVTERGPGFVTASVIDPFGNTLGIMYNAHYLEVLKAKEG